jgi:hypothetical protein
MFMYYCYVRSVLGIVFHCVVLCIVFLYKCTVLMPPGVNPIAVNEYVISYVNVVTAADFHGNTAGVNLLRHFDFEYSHIR